MLHSKLVTLAPIQGFLLLPSELRSTVGRTECGGGIDDALGVEFSGQGQAHTETPCVIYGRFNAAQLSFVSDNNPGNPGEPTQFFEEGHPMQETTTKATDNQETDTSGASAPTLDGKKNSSWKGWAVVLSVSVLVNLGFVFELAKMKQELTRADESYAQAQQNFAGLNSNLTEGRQAVSDSREAFEKIRVDLDALVLRASQIQEEAQHAMLKLQSADGAAGLALRQSSAAAPLQASDSEVERVAHSIDLGGSPEELTEAAQLPSVSAPPAN